MDGLIQVLGLAIDDGKIEISGAYLAQRLVPASAVFNLFSYEAYRLKHQVLVDRVEVEFLSITLR